MGGPGSGRRRGGGSKGGSRAQAAKRSGSSYTAPAGDFKPTRLTPLRYRAKKK